MEGNDPKQALQDKYLTAVKKNWMVWPAVQFTNFKYVPLEHRVLVVNIVSLGELSMVIFAVMVRADFVTGWNCYLSYLNSSSSGEHANVSLEYVSWTARVLLTPSLQNPTYPPDV